jgi:hypothetical protein
MISCLRLSHAWLILYLCKPSVHAEYPAVSSFQNSSKVSSLTEWGRMPSFVIGLMIHTGYMTHIVREFCA